jgi:hypothetical protein
VTSIVLYRWSALRDPCSSLLDAQPVPQLRDDIRCVAFFAGPFGRV